jgi:hypothetical protein
MMMDANIVVCRPRRSTKSVTESLRRPEKIEQKFVHSRLALGMLRPLDPRIGQCWGATPWQNHHSAESMPKASARGVEAESLPPGTCQLPLATMG